MSQEFLIGMSLSLLLGALIGIEREIRKQKENQRDFAGFRTYTFITLLGFLISYLSLDIFNLTTVFIVALAGVFILVGLSYWALEKQNKNQIGLISQIVAILAFLVGSIIALEEYHIAIVISLAITTILFLGNKLHNFARVLKQEEIFATLKFAIMSLIILPLLPNKNYTLLDMPYVKNLFLNQNIISHQLLIQLDVFNFYYLWLMVVFISGIAYVGYILMKTIGAEKGILVTGFLGGLMSSTALTSSFAIESKSYKGLSWPLSVGIVVASSVMFFRILFEVVVLNPSLFVGLFLSLGLMGIVGIILAIYLYLKKKQNKNIGKFEVDSPFAIGPALKFAGLFFLVMFVTKLLTIVIGDSGIYIVSFISGITDVDAITISLSKLALNNSISLGVAQFGILIAAFANTFFKGAICYYLGSKRLFEIILLVFGFIMFVGGFSLLL